MDCPSGNTALPSSALRYRRTEDVCKLGNLFAGGKRALLAPSALGEMFPRPP